MAKKDIGLKNLFFAFLIMACVITPIALALSFDMQQEYNNLSFRNSQLLFDKLSPIEGEMARIKDTMYFKDIITEELDGCCTFPEQLPSDEANSFLFVDHEFNYSFEGEMMERCELFLECKVSSEVFNSEVERISTIELIDGKRPLWSVNLFALPGLVAEYDYEGQFEYVLFDETNYSIYYIVLKNIGTIDNIRFSLDYAPTIPLYKSDLKSYSNKRGFYSIYLL